MAFDEIPVSRLLSIFAVVNLRSADCVENSHNPLVRIGNHKHNQDTTHEEQS
jgi:hypothetical protein